ncbi:M56 family metallopeptidase [Neolewinella lacunae]|uniref:Peptidase M56 domain-containing protein n=1 Tax=Neolewinella lacunae TaxID=1517758 RepID=A0A923PIP1_9BACT|nr:M56 family metallopeptidase [Neolewinella lacunae]MBC6993411.1 hypothetical protein [Neolewinella lacunae]MDN3636313.1 M56 family metallopeptidase [Neolewinella lacunae]
MIDFPLPTAWVEALGWTILHSLWQGLLLAAVLWLASRACRRAQVRYGLAYGTLLAQLAVSLLTFSWVYVPAVAGPGSPTLPPGETLFNFSNAAPGSAWDPTVLLFWTVVFWAFGLVIGTVRLGLSFGRVRRMQRKVEGAVPADFQAKVLRLAQRLGCQRKFRIGLSQYIDGPALVGHLRPMLLFPIALVNQLTPEQAETIILHELAHLRRNDHWWNLLQCVVEVLFYYHPVVWWIGARIREEREYCCDDLVLRHGPGQLAYAQALLYFETQRQHPQTAVGLTGKPGGLLGRVQRFIHQQNLPYQMKSRLFLLPLLTLLALATTAAVAPTDSSSEPETAPTSLAAPPFGGLGGATTLAPAFSAPITTDTLPRGRHQVSTFRNGKSTEVTVENGAIKALRIDGQDIAPVEFDQYQGLVEELLQASKKPAAQGYSRSFNFYDPASSEAFERQMEEMGRVFERTSEELEGSFEGLSESWEYSFEDSEDYWEDFGQRMEDFGERFGESFAKIFSFGGLDSTFQLRIEGSGLENLQWNVDSMVNNGQMEGLRFQMRPEGAYPREYNLEDLRRDRENLQGDEEEKIREMETMIEQLERRKAEMKRDMAVRDRELAERDRAMAERDRELAARNRATEEMRRAARDGASPNILDIMGQLQKEGLLPDEDVRKVAVDQDRLSVNGKKASSAAHARFLEIYQQRAGQPFGKNSSVRITTN